MVKGGYDKNVGMTAIILGNVPPALVVIALMPMPDMACLPYLIGGSLLHFGYQIFLLRAYSLGDFTQVYPIARGAAPMLVALFSVVVLGIDLLPIQLLAITSIGAGIASLCLVRSTTGQRNSAAAAVALVTACFIAGYSLVDGYGARVAGTALGFYAWIAIVNACVLALYMAIRMPGVLQRVGTEGRSTALWGGTAAFIAYASIMWAFTQAPIALVTALRETSIVFALLIGVIILKEPVNLIKVASTFTTLFGAALLKIAR
jgi:drug/metabolite transporter (DMT)-like permease